MPDAEPQSYYAATAGPADPRPFLTGSAQADVCIVGAGYTGLSAALHAAKSGARTIVLESRFVGFGASGRNGGQIHSGHRQEQTRLESWLGRDRAHDLWHIAEEGKSLVRALAAEDCDLKSGLITAAHDKRALREIESDTEHRQTHYGYYAARMMSAGAIAEATGSTVYPGGQSDSGGGHLHPLKYARRLAQLATSAGAAIREGSPVLGLGEATTGGINVRTALGNVRAEKVIVACDAFIGDLLPELNPFIGHVESFITATEPLAPELRPSILGSDSAVADTRRVLDYYRKSSDGRLLFAGRESYWSPPKDIAALVRPRMLKVFPALKATRTEFAWSGTVSITRTRMPHFGRKENRILFGHGYSGHGVALSTIGGKLLAEAALGRSDGFNVLASVPPKPFPGPQFIRKPLITAALLWYKLEDLF